MLKTFENINWEIRRPVPASNIRRRCVRFANLGLNTLQVVRYKVFWFIINDARMDVQTTFPSSTVSVLSY